MSLNFSFRDIKNWEKVCYMKGKNLPMGDIDYDVHGKHPEWKTEFIHPILNIIIYATCAIGMNSITEKNIDEFVARFKAFHAVHTIYYMDKKVWKTDTIDKKQIEAFIGLTTNASPLSPTKFYKKLVTKW